LTRSGRFGVLVVSALMLLFVVWPASFIMRRGLSISVMAEMLGDHRIRRIIGQTVLQAVAATTVSLAIGTVVGAVLGTWEFRGRRAITAFIAAPFAMPTVVVGAAFLAVLAEPIERGWLVVVAANAFYNTGMVARSVGDVWSRLDLRLDAAAVTLGASPRQVVRFVLLPQLLPLLHRLAGLVGALCLGTYGIAVMLGGPFRPTTEVEIWRQTTSVLRVDRAAGLSIVQLMLIGTWLWWTSRAVETTVAAAPGQRALSRRRSADRVFRRWGAPVLAAMCFVIAAPFASLLERALRGTAGSLSFEHFRALGQETRGSGLVGAPLHTVWTSLRLAAIAAAGAVCTALIAAVSLRRMRSRRMQRVVETLASAPLAVSSVMLGLGFLLAFARPPVAWRASAWLIGVAQAVVAVPYAMRIIVAAQQRIATTWRDCAATLGASPLRVWWTIDRPLLSPALRGAASIAAVIGLGELGASSVLSRPESTTLPVAIARLSGRPGSSLIGQANALAVVLFVLTVGLTLLSLRSGDA
jgi:thiamine transport system permease protein